MILSESKEFSLPQMPEGRFSADGLALNAEAKQGALERYQCAIDLVAEEMEALNRRFSDYQLDVCLVGSVTDLRNFRPGVYDVMYAEYASVSKRKLAQSTSAAGGGSFPSDLDFVVEVGGVDESDVGRVRKIYASLSDECEGIARRVFRKTGILIELSPRTVGSYPTTPLSELRYGRFLEKFSLQ